MKKERVDILLVEQGLSETREKAKRAIMAGIVYANEERVDKPGEKIAVDIPLTIKGKDMPYVSRGGYKLEKALTVFKIDLQGKRMIDVGASTGGFTDCALQNGVCMSYAVDVGYNQLAWKLRSDERVIVLERMNFRYAKPEDFCYGLPNFATVDVSFISLKLILPVLAQVLVDNGECVCLVKPQFEAGREQVGKNGIIRDQKIHLEVLEKITEFSLSLGYAIKGVTFSPITGGNGNIEFLLYLKWKAKAEEPCLYAGATLENVTEQVTSFNLQQIVKDAHNQLKSK